MTYKELKVAEAIKEINISKLLEADVRQKKIVKSISLHVKDIIDILRNKEMEINTIIDETLRNSSSTIKQAESFTTNGKAFHEKSLRFEQ